MGLLDFLKGRNAQADQSSALPGQEEKLPSLEATLVFGTFEAASGFLDTIRPDLVELGQKGVYSVIPNIPKRGNHPGKTSSLLIDDFNGAYSGHVVAHEDGTVKFKIEFKSGSNPGVRTGLQYLLDSYSPPPQP